MWMVTMLEEMAEATRAMAHSALLYLGTNSIP